MKVMERGVGNLAVRRIVDAIETRSIYPSALLQLA